MRFTALLALVCAFVLAGCGADVNTQLSLHDDYSGQRQFILTMAEDDLESLSGGLDAAEQALQTHMPEVLTFEGVESEVEGYSATFAMNFDDAEDYRQKITALLDASNVADDDRAMNVNVHEEQLVTSIDFEEDFYNDDLMGWASDALIEEGVVSANTAVLTSNGAAEVLFDGEEVSTSTSLPRINFNLTDDRRFEEIGLDFEVLESGDFQTTMTYLVSPDHAAVHNDFINQRVDQLNDMNGLDGAIEDSGPVENHGSESAEPRQIRATFTSAEAVEAGMQTLLANEQASFDITDVTDNGSPDVVTEYTGSNWNCDSICNPDNIQQLDGETEYPDHWQMVDQRRNNNEFYLKINRGMPLDSLSSTTRMDFGGSMTQTFEFVVSDQTLNGHEDAVAQLFEPTDDAAAFDTNNQSDNTIYTVEFNAQDAHTLGREINDYLEDKGITETVSLQHEPLNGVWANYNLDVDLTAIWALATGGVEGTATFQVELPPMHSGTSGNTTSSDGTIVLEESTGGFNVQGSGPTTTTVWIISVLAAVLVLVVIALLLWRRSQRARSLGSNASDARNARPYNVQGPRDELTETQIYRSPLTPETFGDPASITTDLPHPMDREYTLVYDQRRPFPDVPIPSATDYREFQRRLDDGSSTGESAQEDERSSDRAHEEDEEK